MAGDVMEFEEWIKEQVAKGVFESEEEAYKVMAYILYLSEKENTINFLRSKHFPLNLKKAKELGSDILDEEKIMMRVSEVLKEAMEDTIKDIEKTVKEFENKISKIEAAVKVLEGLNEAIGGAKGESDNGQ